MSSHTNIQWADTTVTPLSGCNGCEIWKLLEAATATRPAKFGGPCYAGNLQETRLSKSLPHLYSKDFTEVRMIPGRMNKAAGYSDLTGTSRPDKPWLDGLPRVIFVADLGDLFSREIIFEFIKTEVFDTAVSTRGGRHIWMLLTKQPFRMSLFDAWLQSMGIAWPNNVMAGTSITTQKTLSRWRQLAKVRAPYKFLSVEPQWEPITLGCADDIVRPSLVIQGGESDQGVWKAHPFDVAWARSMRDECRTAGVPYFLKQFGSRVYDSFYRSGVADQAIHFKDHHGGEWEEWSEDLRVREFPRVTGYTPPVPDGQLF